MDDNRRRLSSWPSSLLPGMVLAALLAGSAATATSSGDAIPVLDMTVTTTK